MAEKESIEEYAARMKCFLENRPRFPLQELARYAGQCIAWAPDGTAIVASAADYDTLAERVRAAGFDVFRCVFSYVEDT